MVAAGRDLALAQLGELFAENVLFAGVVGLAARAAAGRRLDPAALCIATIFVQVLTVPLHWGLRTALLTSGGKTWAGLPAAAGGAFAAAAVIAVVAAAMRRSFAAEPTARPGSAAVGTALAAVVFFGAMVGVPLFMVSARLSPGEAAAYGLGSGAGWAIALLAGAALRWRSGDVPAVALGATGFGASTILAFTAM